MSKTLGNFCDFLDPSDSERIKFLFSQGKIKALKKCLDSGQETISEKTKKVIE